MSGDEDPPGPWLIANLGAEDPAGGDAPAALRATRAVARLWRLLFAPAVPGAGPPAWPEALGAPPANAAFPWLDRPGRTFAWLVTDEAASEAARRDAPLDGPSPRVVRHVHDKAFAWHAALAEGHVPRSLRDLVQILGADELADAEAALASIAARVGSWPAWCSGATLKPRLGSSGRGRVAFDRGGAETDAALRGALPRLRQCGGAILEPWLERRLDLSAQLHVDPGEGLLLLGTLEQRVTAAGVPRGLRGTLDRRGRVTSGSAHDEALREAAVAVASAARDEGYFGPCGVDAFVFLGPGGQAELRPVVELNARFTLGTVALGLARRVLGVVRSDFDLDASERLWFELALDAPAGAETAADVRRLDLGGGDGGETGEDGPRPALLLARERESLDAALGAG